MLLKDFRDSIVQTTTQDGLTSLNTELCMDDAISKTSKCQSLESRLETLCDEKKQ